MRYGGTCLGVMAVVTFFGALWTRGLRGDFDFMGLVSVWAIAAVGIVFLDGGVQLGSAVLEPIGQLFRAGPERAHHGLATVLTGCGALALSLRLFLTRGRPRSAGPWGVFLVFALLALFQGFLAYRGVSAIYILAVPAALAWRAGWRAQVARGEAGFVAKLLRAPSRQVDSTRLGGRAAPNVG